MRLIKSISTWFKLDRSFSMRFVQPCGYIYMAKLGEIENGLFVSKGRPHCYRPFGTIFAHKNSDESLGFEKIFFCSEKLLP